MASTSASVPALGRTLRFAALGVSFLAGAAATGLAITPDALAQRIAQAVPTTIIDVRATHDFQTSHIPGAINIPIDALSRRQLPPFKDVVIVTDGRGVLDPQQAVGTLKSKLGIDADVLEGGFAAWESGTRDTTRKTGVTPEVLPSATYAQVAAGLEPGVILVDLRTTAPSPSAAALPGGNNAVDAAADPIDRFARKLPGASVAGDPFSPTTKKTSQAAALRTRQPASFAPAAGGTVTPLLVLIDNNDGRAQEVARQLIASGNRRFVILAGGADAVRLEGKSLIERTGGTINVGGQSQ